AVRPGVPRGAVAGVVQSGILEAGREPGSAERPGQDEDAGASGAGVTLMKTPNWTAARAAMLLDPAVANLNTGSFGPLPRVVFERAMELRRPQAEAPMDFPLRRA